MLPGGIFGVTVSSALQERQVSLVVGCGSVITVNFHPNCRMELVQSDAAIMMGKPAVAGTRVTVKLILAKLAAGESVNDIIAAHSRLTREGVSAALAYAAEALKTDAVYPLPEKAA